MLYLVFGLFFLAALGCIVMWLRSGINQSASGEDSGISHEAEIMNDRSKDLGIPREWDPQVIEQKITSLANSNNIAVLDHFVQSVKTRIIMRQDARTARTSTEFMRTLIERLGVMKQLRTAYDDLNLYEKELDIRVTNLDIERLKQDLTLQDLQHKKETQTKINDLEHQLKELDYQFRIARLKKDIDAVENPPPPPSPPPPPPSREEQRKRKRQESEERLDKLRRDRAADIARMHARNESEEAIRRRENVWDDAFAEEEEELRKWL